MCCEGFVLKVASFDRTLMAVSMLPSCLRMKHILLTRANVLPLDRLWPQFLFVSHLSVAPARAMALYDITFLRALRPRAVMRKMSRVYSAGLHNDNWTGLVKQESQTEAVYIESNSVRTESNTDKAVLWVSESRCNALTKVWGKLKKLLNWTH